MQIGTLTEELAIGVDAPTRRDVEAEPYRRLALAVICAAVSDFGGWPGRLYDAAVGMYHDPKRQMEQSEHHGPGYRLARIREAVQAGEFLVERHDPVTRHWFAAAGINRDQVARHPEWITRLGLLRAQLQEMERQRFPLWASQPRGLANRLAKSKAVAL